MLSPLFPSLSSAPVRLSQGLTRRGFISGIALAGTAFATRARGAPTPLRKDRLTVAGCSFPNHNVEQMLRAAAELGFAGVELAVFAEKDSGPDRYPWVVVESLTDEQRVALKALIGSFSLVTTHLPYGPTMRPLAADPAIRESSRRELHRALRDSAFWGATVANIHVLSEPNVSYVHAKPELVALYRELGDSAQRHGIRLAIETTRPYRCAEFLELIRAIDHPNIGGTVDTGHMHFFRSELPVAPAERGTPEGIRRYNDFMLETISALGPKLFHLHVNDLRVADWREHFVPGTGIIDWPRLFDRLQEIGYGGALVAELLYYQGAADTGALLTRAFTQRTPDGAALAGLRATQAFLKPFLR